MKRKLFFVFLLFFASIASANIVTDLNVKNSFNNEDQIFFDYTLTSDIDANDVIILPHVKCPLVPVSFLIEKTINLKKNIPFNGVFSDLVVQDFFEPQECTAYIKFISPIQKKIEKNFNINTEPSFSFQLKACRDRRCTKESKVFEKNRAIYFDYKAGVENPSVTLTLIYPDKTIKQLTPPRSIFLIQTGTYNLEVTASKAGYKAIKKKTKFSVISGKSKIKKLDLVALKQGEVKRLPLVTGQVVRNSGDFQNFIFLLTLVVLAIAFIMIKKK